MADEISREALLIYLDSLRTLETIIHESDRKTIEIKEKFSEKESSLKNTIGEEPIDPSYIIDDYHKEIKTLSKKIYLDIALIIICIIGIIVVWCPIIVSILRFKHRVGRLPKKSIDYYNPYIMATTFFVSATIVCIWRLIYNISEKKSANKSYQRYISIKALYPENLAFYNNQKSRIMGELTDIQNKFDQQMTSLTQETDEMLKLLKQAYSANIIPLQFRNIQGVYYLYDYLSTSSQSLSNALMQCNLDAIKQKLDEMINLQSEAIVQQAQANAALYEQNQRILETAQATMENTAVAAKYAQITAVNSELSLKLQKKQLAYQRMDFWLLDHS